MEIAIIATLGVICLCADVSLRILAVCLERKRKSEHCGK